MVKKDLNVNVVEKEDVDIEDAIDATGIGRYNYLLLATSCVITVGATMDMLGYSLVVPAASCELNLTLEQGGIIKSVSFAGFLFGLPWGYTSDKKGRKSIIFLAVTAGFIFSTLTSFSTSFTMMLVLKFFASCFSTASMTLVTTYLGESTCRKKRNSYIFMQNMFSTVGDFTSFVLAYLILPLDFAFPIPLLATYRSWRLCSLLMSLPLGVGAIMICFLEESPKFLLEKGQSEKAMDVLRTIFKSNNGQNAVYPVKSLMTVVHTCDIKTFWNSVVMKTTPMFKPPLLWRTLQLFLLLSICCSTNNAFFMWFPTMVDSLFTSAHEDTNFCQKIVATITSNYVNDNCLENNTKTMIYAGLIVTLIATACNLTALIFADWRRTTIFTLLIIAGAGCVVLNLVTDRYISLVLFCMIEFTGLAIGSVYSYYVDVYPTSFRGLATGLGTMVGRTVSLGGVALVGSTIVNFCQLTFYCWAIFVLSGLIAAIFLPTESDAPKKNNAV